MRGDLPQAARFLERVRQSLGFSYRHAHSIYHHSKALYHLLDGDAARALEHARKASEIAVETGYVFAVMICRYGLAQVLIEQGALAEGRAELASVYELAVRSGSKVLEFMSLAALGRVAFKQGEDAQGDQYVQEAVRLGRKHSFRNFIWWWQPALMADLLTRALAAGVEEEYVRDLLQTHRVVVSPPPYHIDAWPWTFRIRTLGRFEIARDSRPIQTAARAYKRPLDILKVVVAFGGRDVSVSRVKDALWPDSDGDAAHSAFSTTLSRLRSLLASKDVLTLQGGKLTFEDNICWVDTWAFADLLGRAERQWQEGAEEAALHSCETALALYQGPFLAEESAGDWIVLPRERLSVLFVDAMKRLGLRHEERGDFEEAVFWYRKALDTDPVQERFYQRTMVCCHRLGRHAEVERVFRRCKEELRSVLGVDPSPATVAIYEGARGA
jgi:DNA-binding SARP family transcriptional activator